MPARFEVDDADCTGCGLCLERAPENLEMVSDDGVARVFAQPANDDEEQACFEAAEYCPLGGLAVAGQSWPEENRHAEAEASRTH